MEIETEKEESFETKDVFVEGIMFNNESKILILKEDDDKYKWKP